MNDLLMTNGIEEQLTPIRDVSHRIGAGAGTLGNVSDLRTILVEILERRERDPGIEAAAHDLYEGAVAIVESGTPPGAARRGGAGPPRVYGFGASGEGATGGLWFCCMPGIRCISGRSRLCE